MHVTSIKSFKNTNFQGHTRYYSISDDMYNRYDSRHLELRDTPPEKIYGYCELFEDKFRRAIYPNVVVERTYPKYCFSPSAKVYIADPMEGITDEIRKSVDYVIHDVVPKYPDVNEEVSKEYFFDSYGDEKFAKEYETIRDYYKRLEAADLRTLSELKLSQEDSKDIQDKIAYYKARIADSEYQQWQAQECLNIYNKGKDLRLQKYQIEREIGSAEGHINSTKHIHIPYNNSEITQAQNMIRHYNDDIAALEKRKKLYYEILTLPESLSSDIKTSKDYMLKDETRVLVSKGKIIMDLIEKCKDAISKAEKTIEHKEQELSKMDTEIKALNPKISEKEILLAQVKARLIPLFDELKHFYARQKILRP